jgi:hypothetical protein
MGVASSSLTKHVLLRKTDALHAIPTPLFDLDQKASTKRTDQIDIQRNTDLYA